MLGFFLYFFSTETKTQLHMSRTLRLLLPLAFLTFYGITVNAQICTPDTQYTVVGLYPDSLAEASIGVPYEQVVHVVIPQDTIVDLPPFGSLTVDLCALTLDSIPNLPDGLIYECSGGDCTWQVDHTDSVINRVCVKISGTPTEAVLPDDSLLVYATVTAGAFNAGTGTCDPLTITLPDSLTTIIYKTQLKVTNSTSVDKKLNSLGLSLYPNPSQSRSAIMTFALSKDEIVTVKVRNMQGQVVAVVLSEYFPSGSHEVLVNTEDLPSGVYIVDFQTETMRQHTNWVLK